LTTAWSLKRFRRLESEASLGTLEDFADRKITCVLDCRPSAGEHRIVAPVAISLSV
jgi:hypothetical protein